MSQTYRIWDGQTTTVGAYTLPGLLEFRNSPRKRTPFQPGIWNRHDRNDARHALQMRRWEHAAGRPPGTPTPPSFRWNDER